MDAVLGELTLTALRKLSFPVLWRHGWNRGHKNCIPNFDEMRKVVVEMLTLLLHIQCYGFQIYIRNLALVLFFIFYFSIRPGNNGTLNTVF